MNANTVQGYLETQSLSVRVQRLGGEWHGFTRGGRFEVGERCTPGGLGHWAFSPSTSEANRLDGQPLSAEADAVRLVAALRSVGIDAEIGGEGLGTNPRIRNARIEAFPGGQCAVAVPSEIEQQAREIFAETGLSPRELAEQRAGLLAALASVIEWTDGDFSGAEHTERTLLLIRNAARAAIARARGGE